MTQNRPPGSGRRSTGAALAEQSRRRLAGWGTHGHLLPMVGVLEPGPPAEPVAAESVVPEPVIAEPAAAEPVVPEPVVGPSRWRLFREGVADRVPPNLREAWGPVSVPAVVLLVILVPAVLTGVLVRTALATPSAEGTGGSATVEVTEAGTSVSDGSADTAAVVLVVDVVGRVHRPGVVRLPSGSRVVDAVQAAGGATDEAAVYRINLARLLTDGEQVFVPGLNDPLPSTPRSTTGSAVTDVLDLNSATAAELEELPGIGPVLSERIVDWRTAHGRFTTVDELREVEGIGDKLLAQLRPLVRV